MDLKITICIPTRLDNIDYFLELIASIENQTVLPNEIIIVASGRDPIDLKESIDILKKQLSKNLNFEFIVSSKKGLAQARNIGIDHCKTDILIFGDDDDIWHRDKVRLVGNAINKNHPCLIKHYHNSCDGNKIKSVPLKNKPSPNGFSVGFSNLIGGGSAISGSLEVFKAVRFFEYIYCEDWDFWIRSFLAGINIIQIDKELVTYRVHKKRMTASFLKVYRYENKIRLKFLNRLGLVLIGLAIGFIKSTLAILIRSIVLIFRKF